jgi:hypothetical protein
VGNITVKGRFGALCLPVWLQSRPCSRLIDTRTTTYRLLGLKTHTALAVGSGKDPEATNPGTTVVLETGGPVPRLWLPALHLLWKYGFQPIH